MIVIRCSSVRQRSTRTLFEEPSNADAEAFQNAGKHQFVVGSERGDGTGRAEDMGGLRLGITHNDHQCAGPEVFRSFFKDFTPRIARRANLNDELGDLAAVIRAAAVAIESSPFQSQPVFVAINTNLLSSLNPDGAACFSRAS